MVWEVQRGGRLIYFPFSSARSALNCWVALKWSEAESSPHTLLLRGSCSLKGHDQQLLNTRSLYPGLCLAKLWHNWAPFYIFQLYTWWSHQHISPDCLFSGRRLGVGCIGRSQPVPDNSRSHQQLPPIVRDHCFSGSWIQAKAFHCISPQTTKISAPQDQN